MLTVPIYFEFASTLCFAAHRVMERLSPRLAELGVELEWRPVDLAQLLGWHRGAAVDPQRRQNALLVLENLEVTARSPTHWLDSRPAHAIFLGLSDEAKRAAWRERVWSAVFEEGRDIGLPNEIERLTRDLAVKVEGDDARRYQSVEEATLRARRDGVTGAPTFMLDEWPFGGIQEERTMMIFFERYARKKEREAAGR